MMRISKLYIKIFLIFIGLFIITEILIFSLFRATFVKPFRHHIKDFLRVNTRFISSLIEYRMSMSTTTDNNMVQSIDDFIIHYSKIFRSNVWIESPAGDILLKTFEGAPPEIPHRRLEKRGDLYFLKRPRIAVPMYIRIPIQLTGNNTGYVHILRNWSSHEFSETTLLLGFLGIGIFIAIAVYFMSHMVTVPLKNLKETAREIAEGNLDKRAEVKSSDEIGELGTAFNSMADTVNRMINGTRELTANISHELRSPLARIRVAQELIREETGGTTNGRIASHLGSIDREIEDMDILIGRILELSELYFREKEKQKEEYDILKVLKSQAERFDHDIRSRGLSFRLELPDYEYRITANGDDLRSVFSNVFDNAVKFTSPGGYIGVSAAQEKNRLAITIENSCETVPGENISRIFEPFFRDKRAGNAGNGLGLAIVKKIVESCSGEIRAETLENGFRIVIALPFQNRE